MIDGYNTYLTPNGYTLEPIGHGKYLVAKDNHFQIIAVERSDKKYVITVGKETYEIKPELKELLTKVPTEKQLLEAIESKPNLDIKELFLELVEHLKINLDLENEHDYFLVALFILQSYKKEFLNAYFFLSADADKGSAKTVLLENISNLAYRSELVGGTTIASLRDLISTYKGNILVDEIDQISKDLKSEVMGILRKGQRRGNKIYKQVKNADGDFRPKAFDVSGSHAFVYRGVVEDALRDRSLSIQPKRSMDNTLPIINFHKVVVSSSLVVKLFLWRTTNYYLSVKRKSALVVEVVVVVAGGEVEERRKKLFDQFTKSFSPETLEYMSTLYGRNMELFYVIHSIAKLTGLPLQEYLEKIFDKKKDEDSFAEDYYYEYMSNALRELYLELRAYDEAVIPNKFRLKRGEFTDCLTFPNGEFNVRFTNLLKSQGISNIGSNKRLSLMRQLGFVKGVNWGKNQKIGKPYAVPCLIFTKAVKRKLQIDKIEKKEKESKNV